MNWKNAINIGIMKAVTFSYDDGVTQDKRFVEMLDRYNLKGTFNINSGRLGLIDTVEHPYGEIRNVISEDEVKTVYKNHEVAVHTLTHPFLTELEDDEILYQIEKDQENLSRIVGYDVVGMAYPGGGERNNNQYVADFIKKNTNIKYARTITSTYNFDIQDDLYRFKPTISHNQIDKMFELAEEFIALKTDTPKLFYIWGHSYEFDSFNSWERMEEFCRLISGHKDIFYGTNREVLL